MRRRRVVRARARPPPRGRALPMPSAPALTAARGARRVQVAQTGGEATLAAGRGGGTRPLSHLERVFEPRFIHDSYACRQGKGTLAASDRLMTFWRQATANGRRSVWALKLDVASFFPSIHKQTLFAIICRHVSDPEPRWRSPRPSSSTIRPRATASSGARRGCRRPVPRATQFRHRRGGRERGRNSDDVRGML